MLIQCYTFLHVLHGSKKNTYTMEFLWVLYPKATFVTLSRFLASTSPRCGSCARTLCVLRDTASCDFASQSSSRCSSGNLTPSVQVYPPPSFALRRMCPASSERAGFKRILWLKIPRQNLTSQNILKHRTNHNFLSLFPNGDSPPSYFFFFQAQYHNAPAASISNCSAFHSPDKTLLHQLTSFVELFSTAYSLMRLTKLLTIEFS